MRVRSLAVDGLTNLRDNRGVREGQTVPTAPADSPTARAFGAKVDLASGSLSLCLVTTRGSAVPAINSVGGTVVAVLSPDRVIAVVDMTLLGRLQRHPDVIRAGSVSVDPARFAQFQRLVGLPG